MSFITQQRGRYRRPCSCPAAPAPAAPAPPAPCPPPTTSPPRRRRRRPLDPYQIQEELARCPGLSFEELEDGTVGIKVAYNDGEEDGTTDGAMGERGTESEGNERSA